MSRFQIKTRPNTINVNQNDFEKINAEINDFCDTAQVEPTSFKELFHNLLDFARFGAKNQSTPAEPSQEVEGLQNEISLKSDEIAQLTERIKILETQNEELEAINKDQFAKELARTDAEQSILKVPVTPDQLAVLQGIAQNRLEKNYSDQLDSPDEIVRKIVFREPYLYNHWGDFYTGL